MACWIRPTATAVARLVSARTMLVVASKIRNPAATVSPKLNNEAPEEEVASEAESGSDDESSSADDTLPDNQQDRHPADSETTDSGQRGKAELGAPPELGQPS